MLVPVRLLTVILEIGEDTLNWSKPSWTDPELQSTRYRWELSFRDRDGTQNKLVPGLNCYQKLEQQKGQRLWDVPGNAQSSGEEEIIFIKVPPQRCSPLLRRLAIQGQVPPETIQGQVPPETSPRLLRGALPHTGSEGRKKVSIIKSSSNSIMRTCSTHNFLSGIWWAWWYRCWNPRCGGIKRASSNWSRQARTGEATVCVVPIGDKLHKPWLVSAYAGSDPGLETGHSGVASRKIGPSTSRTKTTTPDWTQTESCWFIIGPPEPPW